jgi:Protein of unknown function (DUF541)
MAKFPILPAFLTLTALTGTLGFFSPASRAAEVMDRTIAQAASAPATSAESSGSLFVTGTGQMNVPATQAVITLSFYPVYPTDYSDPSAVQTPQVLPTDLKLVVDAATSAGIVPGSVKAYPDFASPGAMRVRMVVDQPNPTKVEQVINDVNTAVIKGNRYSSSSVYVGYLIADCQSVENQVRQAAMTDARNRANALATIAGMQVGNIVSLSENSVSWGNNYGTLTCPTSNDVTIYADAYSLPAYDPATPAVVKVLYSLGVTYGIR